ncbi:hypothetical protein Tco_1363512 [Tanacetum coccineum]
MSVFKVRSSDEEITPANDRLSKVDGYYAVPPPITGNFLTPRADISFAGLDEYAIRKKIIESKTTELNTDTSKSKTSESIGKINKVEKSNPKINRDKVIIEDWNSDDEDDVYEVNTVSPVKTNETQTVKTQVDKIGQISQKERIGFKKIKACFVCEGFHAVPPPYTGNYMPSRPDLSFVGLDDSVYKELKFDFIMIIVEGGMQCGRQKKNTDLEVNGKYPRVVEAVRRKLWERCHNHFLIGKRTVLRPTPSS